MNACHSVPVAATMVLRSVLMAAFAMLALGARAEDAPGPQTAEVADLSIEQLMNLKVDTVYAASRYAQKVTRAPSSISILTAEDIHRLGFRTLTEALRSVRGLYASDDRNYTYLGMRGFLRPNDYNTRVLVLIDGHRLNDNIFDSGTVGREGMVDISLIDRVEIIRGPSSSIYGSSAFLGVINVVTRHGREVAGGEATVEAGSFNTSKAALNVGGRRENGFEWLASAASYHSNGAPRLYIPEFDQRISSNPGARDNGVAAGLDDERALNLFTGMSYGDWALTGFFSDRFKRVPTASFGTVFDDGREATRDYRGYFDLHFDHSFSADLNLQARLYYDNYTYYGAYPYPADEDADTQVLMSHDGTVGEWVGTQWQLTARLLDRHTVIVGGEYRDNLREYQFSYLDLDSHVYTLRDDRSSRTFGLFAQDEIELAANLRLTAGLRYDYYLEAFGGTTNPRAALIYSPWATTTFKLLVGQAYRAPNPYERYYNVIQSTRPELRPERIKTYELVAERYIGEHYRLSASVYDYDVLDLIGQAATEAGELYFDNQQSVEATGLEIEAEARFDSGLLARASYVLQRTRDGRTDQALSSSPQHLGKLSLAVPLFHGKVFAGLDAQYNGTSATVSGSSAGHFFIGNLTLTAPRVGGNLALTFGVYNLFDTHYGYPGSEDHAQDVIEQDGRTVRGSATYRF